MDKDFILDDTEVIAPQDWLKSKTGTEPNSDTPKATDA